MMLMMASILFFACDKDEDKTLSPEEAKTELTQLTTDLKAKIAEMEETQGMQAMENLAGLSDPFASTSKATQKTAVISTIKRFMLPIKPGKVKSDIKPDDRFLFDAWVGTYTWNHTYKKWDVTSGNPSDKIIINFPTDSSGTTNDAILTIHVYEDILIGEDCMPTDIEVDLYVNDIKIVSIDLAATWVTTGDNAGEPITLDLTVFLYPFDFVVNFEQGTTSTSIDVAIEHNDEKFFSAGVGATYETASDTIPSNVNGYIQLFDVKFQADIDVKDLLIVIKNYATYTSEEELLAAINNEIAAAVYVSGVKAADIELVKKSTVIGDITLPIDIVFVYSDGSSESAIPYFVEFIDELEDFFKSLEEYYSKW